MNAPNTVRQEIERIKRVSDQLCTMHAILRDRYRRLAFILNAVNLLASTWILAMVFVEPAIGTKLNPTGLENVLFYGLLSVAIFMLTIIQLITQFPERAAAHCDALKAFANVKSECAFLLSQSENKIEQEYSKVSRIYAFAGENVVPIPDRMFNTMKQSHTQKVAISRYLDKHPGASICLIKVCMWLRDNFHLIRKQDY